MQNAREIYGYKWSEKEYLMVLHAYFQHRGEAQHADTPFVVELSGLLGRTPHSILYRLQNFSSVDPSELEPRRKGKVHLTDYGRRIFTEWAAKRDSLCDTAEAFMRDVAAQMEPDIFNPDPVRIPVTFRSFELLDEIGRGGFGVVFSCLDTRSDRTRAIKVIDGARLRDPECLHRFQREIRALRAVNHPNVIRIYEDNLEQESRYPGYVMDLAECDLPTYIGRVVKGRPEPLARPVLTSSEASAILFSVVDAVRSLHEAVPAIIHRDVNPNNILRLFDGTWVLADFSLAKFLPPAPVSTSFVTETHAGMGTSHYTAPEQYRDLRSADGRSDVHALGWLIRDLFSSEDPYPRREVSGLPPALDAVFRRATEFRKEDRYQSVAELQVDLVTALDEVGAQPATISTLPSVES